MTSPGPKVRVAAVGMTERAEFAPLVAWWDARADLFTVRRPEELLDKRLPSKPPRLILLLQSYPGQFSRSALEQVLHQAPLARFVNIYGGWCESESRTGEPPVAVVRVHWTHAIVRFAAEWDRLERGVCPGWSAPWTMIDEDRDLLYGAIPSLSPALGVAVCSASREMESALMDMITAWNGSPYRWSPQSPALRPETCGVIWDDLASLRGQRVAWEELKRVLDSTIPRLALTDFPRASDELLADPGGPLLVLAKPFRAEDLAWGLRWMGDLAMDVKPHPARRTGYA